MRDRLIELRRKAWVEWQQSATEVDFEEYCADYLIAKGVIVPPCKVGDTVYCIRNGRWGALRVRFFQVYEDTILCAADSDRWFFASELGKTVFLTKEEAEAALKGGAE